MCKEWKHFEIETTALPARSDDAFDCTHCIDYQSVHISHGVAGARSCGCIASAVCAESHDDSLDSCPESECLVSTLLNSPHYVDVTVVPPISVNAAVARVQVLS